MWTGVLQSEHKVQKNLNSLNYVQKYTKLSYSIVNYQRRKCGPS